MLCVAGSLPYAEVGVERCRRWRLGPTACAGGNAKLKLADNQMISWAMRGMTGHMLRDFQCQVVLCLRRMCVMSGDWLAYEMDSIRPDDCRRRERHRLDESIRVASALGGEGNRS